MSRADPAVLATFADLAITTFAVTPEALRALLPADCVPEVVTLRDGQARALVSAVSFRARAFRLRALPWLAAAFTQVNYRAYVRVGGESAVWFFGTAVGLPWVLVPRYILRLPWHRARIAVDAQWEGDLRCRRYALRQESAWGAATLDAQGDTAPRDFDGFETAEAAHRLLSHPLVGHCRRRDGSRAIYRVGHEPLRVTRLHATVARFQVLEDLGLLVRGATPHSVLAVREAEFDVWLP